MRLRAEPCFLIAGPLEGEVVAYAMADSWEDEARLADHLAARTDLAYEIALAFDRLRIELHERHGGDT
jgi:hypothetical protein